jgi:hypothetical protein
VSHSAARHEVRAAGRLCEVADDAERPMIECERRLLVAAVVDAFPDSEERAVVERSDRLGLGGAP